MYSYGILTRHWNSDFKLVSFNINEDYQEEYLDDES